MLQRICLVAVLVLVAFTGSARADVFDDNPSAAYLDGTVYVFARDAGDRVLERRMTNGAWSDWSEVPGLTVGAGSGPSALAFGQSLMLFVRGQDGAVWWNQADPQGAWFGWRSLGGQVTSAPSAGLRYGTTTVDLGARGVNNELYHRSLVLGQAWSSWETFGGNLGSGPSVVGFHVSGSIDVFTRDVGGNVAQRYWQNGNWYGPFDLGGQITGAPGSATAWLNRLDLYVRGTNNLLYYHEHPNGPSKVWTLVDGTAISSSPAATSDAPGHELIFARIGGDLQMRGATVPQPAMGNPTFTGWTSLGAIALPSTPPPIPTPAPQPAPAPTPVPVQPAAPLITIAPTISYQFSAGSKSTRLTTLNVTAVPAGATVKATCPKGCSKKTYTVTKKKAGTVSLKAFIKRPLKAGTKITVVTTKPGTIGSHKVLTIRAGKRPSVTARCLPPGVTKPQPC